MFRGISQNHTKTTLPEIQKTVLRCWKVYPKDETPFPESKNYWGTPVDAWKKSGIHQLRLVVYPCMFFKVLYIPGGGLPDVFHQYEPRAPIEGQPPQNQSKPGAPFGF